MQRITAQQPLPKKLKFAHIYSIPHSRAFVNPQKTKGKGKMTIDEEKVFHDLARSLDTEALGEMFKAYAVASFTLKHYPDAYSFTARVRDILYDHLRGRGIYSHRRREQ